MISSLRQNITNRNSQMMLTLAVDSDPMFGLASANPLFHFHLEMDIGTTNWFAFGMIPQAAPAVATTNDGVTGYDMWLVYQNANGDWVVQDSLGNIMANGQLMLPLDMQQVQTMFSVVLQS